MEHRRVDVWCLVGVDAMLNKLITIVACFFAILAGVLIFMYKIQGLELTNVRADNTTLHSNNNLLITRLEREHNDALEISRKNRELEDLAKRAVGFDWNRDISGDGVVLWLHENAIRVQGSRKTTD